MKNKAFLDDLKIALSIFILGLVLGGLFTGILTVRYLNNNNKTPNVFYDIKNDSFSTSLVKTYFEKHHVRFSHIVYAQAVLESDNFKSKLFIKNNNMFGMKVPAQRFTFATNPYDYSNYAKYDSVEDCILDYKAWQMQNAYNITSEEGYFNLLKSIYAEDPTYITKLKKIIK